MLTIVHGNNTVASRDWLTSEKEKFRREGKEIVNLEAKNLNLTLLKQALESASLFNKLKLVTIESLFSLNLSQAKDKMLSYLREGNYSSQVIIWEGKQIDGRVLRSFQGKFSIREFKLSPLIFKFLDSLRSGGDMNCLQLFHQCLKSDPPELVFYLLGRRIRDLIVASDLGPAGLERMAPWQKKGISLQAKEFSLSELLLFYRSLLKIDWEIKNGLAVLPLEALLDLALANF